MITLRRAKEMRPQFSSKLFQLLFQDGTQRVGEFPYDVPYLSRADVQKLVYLAQRYRFDDTARRVLLEAAVPQPLVTALLRLSETPGALWFEDDAFWQAVTQAIGADACATYGAVIQRAATSGLHATQSTWTPQRAWAHCQTQNLAARRASAHDVLWARYRAAEQRGTPLTLEQVQRHVTALHLETTLTPPAWFQPTVAQAATRQAAWEQHLQTHGVSVHDLRQQHGDAIRRCQQP